MGSHLNFSNSGICVTWGMEHRTLEGRLISRTASVSPPAWPGCNCLGKYLFWVFKHWLLIYYHSMRVSYAEKKRNDTIPMRYRTGYPSPSTVWKTISGLIALRYRLWFK
jgi:hypothetical protein